MKTKNYAGSNRAGLGIVGILAAVAVVIAVLVGGYYAVNTVSGLTQKANVEDTVSEVQYSLENMDVNALLRRVNPDLADPIRFALAAMGMDGNQAMTWLLSEMCGNDEINSAQDVLESVKTEVIKTEIFGRHAVTETLCTVTVGGEEFFRYLTFEMEYINKNWYIMNVSMSVRSAYD